MIHFVDVNEENWRLDLALTEEQKHYVAAPYVMYARAYAYRNARSRAFVIYDDETPVGAGLYYDCPELNAYDLSQLLIDRRYQHRGYGRTATQMILEEMKKDGKYNKVDLCYIEGNDAAKKLYEQVGFVEIDRDGDEIVMELCFDSDKTVDKDP